MDSFLISRGALKVVENFSSKDEYDPISFPTKGDYNPDSLYKSPPVNWRGLIWTIVSLVIGISIGVYAAYLSWQCNNKLAYNVVYRIIFSIFAYLFGLVYIILYFTMRWDVCRQI